MRMFRVGLAVVLAVMVTPALAVSTKLDFDTLDGGGAASEGVLSAGQLTQYNLDFGVTLVNPNGLNNPLALFDSNCFGAGCSGGDPDLATGTLFDSPQEDLILIVNERATNPPDDNVGGEIIFDFTDPGGVDFTSLVLIDLDEIPAVTAAISFEFLFTDNTSQTISGLDAGGLLLSVTLVNSDFAGDNSYRIYDFTGADLSNVEQLDVTFNNISGGIAFINYDRVNIPVPASLPLLLSAVGLMGWLRLRRRKSA